MEFTRNLVCLEVSAKKTKTLQFHVVTRMSCNAPGFSLPVAFTPYEDGSYELLCEAEGTGLPTMTILSQPS